MVVGETYYDAYGNVLYTHAGRKIDYDSEGNASYIEYTAPIYSRSQDDKPDKDLIVSYYDILGSSYVDGVTKENLDGYGKFLSRLIDPSFKLNKGFNGRFYELDEVDRTKEIKRFLETRLTNYVAAENRFWENNGDEKVNLEDVAQVTAVGGLRGFISEIPDLINDAFFDNDAIKIDGYRPIETVTYKATIAFAKGDDGNEWRLWPLACQNGTVELSAEVQDAIKWILDKTGITDIENWLNSISGNSEESYKSKVIYRDTLFKFSILEKNKKENEDYIFIVQDEGNVYRSITDDTFIYEKAADEFFDNEGFLVEEIETLTNDYSIEPVDEIRDKYGSTVGELPAGYERVGDTIYKIEEDKTATNDYSVNNKGEICDKDGNVVDELPADYESDGTTIYKVEEKSVSTDDYWVDKGTEIQDRYGNVVDRLPDNYVERGGQIYKIETEFIEVDGKKMREGEMDYPTASGNSYSESNMNQVITRGKFIDDEDEYSELDGWGVWLGYELRLLFKDNELTSEQKKVKKIFEDGVGKNDQEKVDKIISGNKTVDLSDINSVNEFMEGSGVKFLDERELVKPYGIPSAFSYFVPLEESTRNIPFLIALAQEMKNTEILLSPLENDSSKMQNETWIYDISFKDGQPAEASGTFDIAYDNDM